MPVTSGDPPVALRPDEAVAYPDMKPGDLVGFRELGVIHRTLKGSPAFDSHYRVIDSVIQQTDVALVIGLCLADEGWMKFRNETGTTDGQQRTWLQVLTCGGELGYLWSQWVRPL